MCLSANDPHFCNVWLRFIRAHALFPFSPSLSLVQTAAANPGHGTKDMHVSVTGSEILLASNRLKLLQAGVLPLSLQSLDGIPNAFRYGLCTVSISLFADPEQILRRFYVFAEEPCKSTITTSEPCSPVFKEAQPRPSKH